MHKLADDSQLRLIRPVPRSLEKRRLAIHFAMLGCDLLLILASFLLAGTLYSGDFPSLWGQRMASMFIPVYALIAIYNSVYSVSSLASLRLAVGRMMLAALLTTGLLIFFTFYMEKTGTISRAIMTLGMITSCGLLSLFRGVVHRELLWRVVPHIQSTLVIRDGGPDIAIENALEVDAVEHGLNPHPDDPAALHRFGWYVENVDRIVVSCPLEKREAWAFVMRAAGVDGELVSHSLQELRPIALKRDGKFISLVVSTRPLGLRQRIVKRAMDLALAGGALVALSPVFALVFVAIKLDDPGPAFFVQRRMGRGNRFFDMFKFRSMKVQRLDHDGNRSASKDDDRVTRVGAFLRKTSLDEIPQLLNVVLGDMSLVGPRPHALGSLAGERLFWEVEENYWRRHSLKPGLTGLAQIRGLRGATDEEHHLTARLDADLEYIASWSPWRDLWIMLMTVRVLVHDRAF